MLYPRYGITPVLQGIPGGLGKNPGNLPDLLYRRVLMRYFPYSSEFSNRLSSRLKLNRMQEAESIEGVEVRIDLIVFWIQASNKRFQRLESHVVTLARSVAHLSSEMRTQHIMIQVNAIFLS